jgi:hypothetical protein
MSVINAYILVAKHQANHARILQLRRTADALDDQIKDSIALLADTRKELLSTPFTDSTKFSRDVPFDELLAYAKRISRFTVPPTFRPAPPKLPEDTAKPSIETEDVVMSNGSSTSPAAPALEGDAQEPPHLAEEHKGPGYAALTNEQKEWLDSVAKAPFIPWPNEEDMKRGALVAVQTMLEQGRDPTTVLGPKEQEEQERKEREASAQRQLESEERAKQRRQSVGGGAGPRPQAAEQPAFEGFDLFNPEDEDGDE